MNIGHSNYILECDIIASQSVLILYDFEIIVTIVEQKIFILYKQKHIYENISKQ